VNERERTALNFPHFPLSVSPSLVLIRRCGREVERGGVRGWGLQTELEPTFLIGENNPDRLPIAEKFF
jgi:hypothetical protein